MVYREVHWLLVTICALATQPCLAHTAQSSCARLDLEPPPTWSISGAWAGAGSELLLVDVVESAVLRYSPSGAQIARVQQPDGGRGTGHLTEAHPLPGGGFLLQEGPTGLLHLDETLRLVSRFDYLGQTVEWQGGEGMIGGISHFVAIGEEVLALVPLRSRGGVIYAVARLGRGGEGPFKGLPLPSFGLQEEQFASRTGPLMASAGGRSFLLTVLESRLGIHRVDSEIHRLSAFPEGFSTPPDLPESQGAHSTVSTLAFMEGAKLPTGLYGRGRYLYLLTREPGEAGTVWRLHQIDPEADRLVRSMTLPTKANHLFLVPGPKHWALVEKGPVTGPGRQAIPSAVRVPSAWIEDPASKALQVEEPPSCDSKDTPGAES